GTVCVVGKMRDLILQLSKSSIYSTKPQFMQIKCSRRRLADYQQDICMATLALCIPIDAAS
ncbi:hypothetical protein M8R81_23650, partial [Enterobacter cloacae]|nr:hypothetical protein [Enterobacter cloacae]